MSISSHVVKYGVIFASLIVCSNFDDYMTIVIWVHDYNNFEGGKTYLIYSPYVIDKI